MSDDIGKPPASGIFLLILVLADTFIISDAFVHNEQVSWTILFTLPLLVAALGDLKEKTSEK